MKTTTTIRKPAAVIQLITEGERLSGIKQLQIAVLDLSIQWQADNSRFIPKSRNHSFQVKDLGNQWRVTVSWVDSYKRGFPPDCASEPVFQDWWFNLMKWDRYRMLIKYIDDAMSVIPKGEPVKEHAL